MSSTESKIEDELDISWLKEEELLLDKNNYVSQQLTQIEIHFIYLDKNKKEVHREKEIAELGKSPQTSHSKMEQKHFSSLVDAHKRHYKLFDIQLYHFPLREDNIQAFSASSPNIKSSSKYLTGVSVDKDLLFEPAILLFHELSGIYVFYIEDDAPKLPPPKSILKLFRQTQSPQTKKVHIVCPRLSVKPQNVAKHATTRKRR